MPAIAARESGRTRARRVRTENEIIGDVLREMFPNLSDSELDRAVDSTAALADNPIRARFRRAVRAALRRE